jgi:hypothetical protein
MVSGKHPMAGLRQLLQSDVMTLISHYPLGPSEQPLLSAQQQPNVRRGPTRWNEPQTCRTLE